MVPNQVVFRNLRRSRLHFLALDIVHLFLFAIAGLTAFLLRFEFSIPPRQVRNLFIALAVWVVVKSVTFHLARVNRTPWRFVSIIDLVRLSVANIVGSTAAAVILVLVLSSKFPRSLYFIDFLLATVLTGGVRLVIRSVLEATGKTREGQERVFIYGAGSAGLLLLREIRQNPSWEYKVCGFIDDDPSKEGMLIHGLPVLGPGRDLPRIAARRQVGLVLIAIPSGTGAQMATILGYCAAAQLSFRTMPSLAELFNSPNRPALRDVAVEDLLGRTPVQIDQDLVATQLKDQVILVTGAAGSIGSELCRQIAKFQPKLLIGLDAAETPLFHIDQEIRQTYPALQFEPLIGSIQNLDRLTEICDEYKPRVIFHAAAYKHVPLMEANIFEAVENNIVGTYNVAIAASRAGDCDFVMISSDKAVRPTSIMGLTKRIAELIVCSMPSYSGKFVSVRFGNVLGSNGSVVPIFKQQIEAGGPVTVTHPEMRRYFMTIPEAVQLVLQASSMGKGREVFVLDMGDPIKIVDLARNLILLCGLRPGEDIEIQYTGIRPGEKLYEEICGGDEETRPTFHEKVRIFLGNAKISDLDNWIIGIRRMARARDLGLFVLLKELVHDYTPSPSMINQMVENDVPGFEDPFDTAEEVRAHGPALPAPTGTA